MIGALWRHLRAMSRLKAHQRRHGNLVDHTDARCILPGCPAPLIASHVPVADALAMVRAHESMLHRDQHRSPWCGLPIGGTPGYWCTEPVGHRGPHRHHLGTVQLHHATTEAAPTEWGPDQAPVITPPERRATWRPMASGDLHPDLPGRDG